MNNTMKIAFVKVQGSWYADLPEYIEQGGSFASCLMVAGAPELIEMMGGKGKDRVEVEIGVEWFPGFDAVLNKEVEGEVADEDGSWATYLTTVYDRDYPESMTTVRPIHSTSFYVGLCPVNKWVFCGYHPDTIYLKRVND